MKHLVSHCCGAEVCQRWRGNGTIPDGFECSVCLNECIPVDAEEWFWDMSVAAAKSIANNQKNGGETIR